MVVIPIMVQSKGWCKEMDGELRETYGGGTRGRGGGSDRMYAISGTVRPGQLCPYCSMTAGNDFIVASCHMTTTLLTPKSVTSDFGLDWSMTSLTRFFETAECCLFAPHDLLPKGQMTFSTDG